MFKILVDKDVMYWTRTEEGEEVEKDRLVLQSTIDNQVVVKEYRRINYFPK